METRKPSLLKDIIIDASVAAAWLLPDEENPVAASILDKFANRNGVVPSLWTFELGNLLLTAERRGRITATKTDEALGLISHLPLEIDEAGDMRQILALGRQHALSYYDATYLELAIRRSLPLATLDKRLIAAVEQYGLLYGVSEE